MNLLMHVEKNKLFWPLLGLCLLFILLRMPSLIEPYWYGDEGIYHVVGKALNDGYVLYKDIWDNKPPLLYVIYAWANSDQMTVRTISLIVGTFSAFVFFFLGQIVLKSQKTALLATSLYVLLFASPILEGNIANAENFMLLPIITSALLIYKSAEHKTNHLSPLISHLTLPISGLLLGFAFLFKIVAIFDLVAFSLFLLLLSTKKLTWKSLIDSVKSLLPFFAGFLIPFVLTTLYFASQGIFSDYIQSVFSRNVDYVGFENYLFGIPQGLLYLKLILLALSLGLIVWKRELFSRPVLFIALWLVFSLFNANFSGRPYTHYLLVLLPCFCLLAGMIGMHWRTKQAKVAGVVAAALLIIILFTFPIYGPGKTAAYYKTSIEYLLGQKDVDAYQSFFDTKTPRDYKLASFIKSRTTEKDKIFIWGDSAQIYTLADKLPPYKYTVSYHVKESKELLKQTQKAIEEVKPKYIIVLPETQPLPFNVPLYIMRFNVEGAIIYERSL